MRAVNSIIVLHSSISGPVALLLLNRVFFLASIFQSLSGISSPSFHPVNTRSALLGYQHKMFSYFLALSLMASAMASEFFSPVPHFGAMLPRDDLIKRQGYYPGTSYCGRGDTCEEACGPTYKQCPSDAGTYCFEPGKNEECCPDGTGSTSNLFFIIVVF